MKSSLTRPVYLMVSNLCFVMGFTSIIASIYIWATAGGDIGGIGAPSSLLPQSIIEQRAYAERFAIFVGLWAPTFFILSNRLKTSAMAMKMEEAAQMHSSSHMGQSAQPMHTTHTR